MTFWYLQGTFIRPGAILLYMDNPQDQTHDGGSDLSEIKAKLYDMQKDMKVIIEQTNRQNIDTVFAYLKSNYLSAIESYINEDAKSSLEKNMVKKCDRRTECASIFNSFLRKNSNLIRQDSSQEDAVKNNKSELARLRLVLPYDKCEVCYSEVAQLFAKQVNLMESMKVYDSNKGKQQEISMVPPKEIVDGMLEPLCHEKRFEILKALTGSTQSFSSLSQLTGLRGGNLLFHLQKLAEAGIIMQRHERGDYMITATGFRIMEGVSSIYSSLACQVDEAEPEIIKGS